MARKDLSRTVIEGGRYYHNSYQRRASHGVERATTREWLDRVSDDLDEAEATAPPPRPHVHKMFRDKLAPAQRWLVAQVGRPWSKVFSELCKKFDSRTVAGRHVVHDHMLKWVTRHDDINRFHYHFELVIDKHGILRKPLWFGRSFSKLRREALDWARHRVCALTYRGWWWFRRVPTGAPCVIPWKCGHARHYNVNGSLGRHFGQYHAFRYAPDGAMTNGQRRYLERLPAELRSQIVIASPWK